MSPAVPPFFPANRGGKLAATRTTRAAVEQLLSDTDLDRAGQVTADLARSAADLVDASRKAQDPRLWLATSARLEQLLAKLGARTGGNDQGEGGESGPGRADPAAELEAIVGGPASVGDPEEPA